MTRHRMLGSRTRPKSSPRNLPLGEFLRLKIFKHDIRTRAPGHIRQARRTVHRGKTGFFDLFVVTQALSPSTSKQDRVFQPAKQIAVHCFVAVVAHLVGHHRHRQRRVRGVVRNKRRVCRQLHLKRAACILIVDFADGILPDKRHLLKALSIERA